MNRADIKREAMQAEANTISGTFTADASKFFDGLFTLASCVWAVVAILAFVSGDTDRGVSDMSLCMLFWIASCQLAPYWNRLAPGYNDRCEVGE